MPFDQPTPIPEDARILLRAADEIRERGWYQGWFEGPNGEVCMLGAIQCARRGATSVWRNEDNSITRLLCMHLKCRGVSSWNDAPDRTKDDVIAAFEGAAARIVAEGV